MTEETKIDNKQVDACKDDGCCCRRIFKTNTSKVVLAIAVIFFAYLGYIKIDEWLTYGKIEKIAKNMILEVDSFGGMHVKYPEHFSALEGIDNKMLLCALAKQQAEIIKHQRNIEESLTKLVNTSSPNPIKTNDTKVTAGDQQPNIPAVVQPGNKPEQPQTSEQQLPREELIKATK